MFERYCLKEKNKFKYIVDTEDLNILSEELLLNSEGQIESISSGCYKGLVEYTEGT